jgi:hypothetical protein
MEVIKMKQKEYKSTGGVYEEGYQRCAMPPRKMSKNESFEKNGYLYVPGLVADPENLYVPRPKESGQYTYYNNRMDKFDYCPDEKQVPGSLARYNIPTYRQLHFLVKKEIEKILDMDLHPTYFYDRFYSPGHILKRHSDRPACEVSVTLQISTTLKDPWPIWFERPDGSESYVLMNNGDGVIYKGTEREHWRDAMPSEVPWWKKKIAKMRGKEIIEWHHQVFLHYVNANGPFCHYAFDATR